MNFVNGEFTTIMVCFTPVLHKSQAGVSFPRLFKLPETVCVARRGSSVCRGLEAERRAEGSCLASKGEEPEQLVKSLIYKHDVLS